MARIKYDRYLLDDENLITITNADTDDFLKMLPESFTNPPLKIKFPEEIEMRLEQFCRDWFEYHNENYPDSEVLPTDGARMLLGELPGWRLIGARLAPELGLWGYCVNERMAMQANGSRQNDEGVMVQFSDNIEVELEVDYADGLPVRRYICKVGDSASEYATEVTEYLGRRKVRKLEYSEDANNGNNRNHWLCHITEY